MSHIPAYVEINWRCVACGHLHTYLVRYTHLNRVIQFECPGTDTRHDIIVSSFLHPFLVQTKTPHTAHV